MAYQFLEADDIEAIIQSKLFTANSADTTPVTMEKIEKKKIAYISAMLSSRYNMAAVFAEEGDNRNQVILDILICLCIYELLQRNAARKVPDNYQEMYERAEKKLEKLQAGKMYADLPDRVDGEGEADPPIIYANTTNKNNYI